MATWKYIHEALRQANPQYLACPDCGWQLPDELEDNHHIIEQYWQCGQCGYEVCSPKKLKSIVARSESAEDFFNKIRRLIEQASTE